MFTTKPGGDWTLLERVKDCVAAISVRTYTASQQLIKHLRWSKELFQYNIHSSEHLSHEEVVAGLIDGAVALVESLGSPQPESFRRRT